MKKGCITYLLAWAALSAVYYQLSLGSELADKPWVPVLLALGAVLGGISLLDLLRIVRFKSLVGRPPQQWQDGSTVVLAGRLRVLRDPVTAPFSGDRCGIVEYSVRRSGSSHSSGGGTGFIAGFLMAPCAVSSPHGEMRLTGFPLMSAVEGRRLGSPGDYERAVDYLRTTQFQIRSGNPIQMLKQLNDVLSDDDGVVKADFKDPGTPLDFIIGGDGATGDYTPELGEPETAGDEQYEEIEIDPARFLHECGHELIEKALTDGAEITAVGTYRKQHAAIDIGSAFETLGNDIFRGQPDAVFAKKIRTSLMGLLFWGGIAAAGHLYAAYALGLF